ncbi:MAG TPA: Y-family DNA polymerase [Candidatus Coprenecus stercoravium]|uniref:Y-family DNA polymerase n=1 Tax=Candidatus Coprenecus stercoravium TaxID=2840735 RepID=A0A9D2K834_9BACT|nr:Y-family DNA polymerase [Candidatus Coprenecus stercoravium]
MYALADCNNFFVSCERVFRPDLEGRPVVVLSNNDGCAIARSNEAKRLGIKMGQPMFEFRHLIESGAVTVFSSNFSLYGDMSGRVQQILSGFSPAIEVYSIDESFMDLTGMSPDTDFDLWAKTVSRECRRRTGIPVSVGVSPTKTLAKIASKLCKQYPATKGGCWMYRPQDVEKVLRKFPIKDIWGIGRRYAKRFMGYFGMTTAWDLYSKNEAWISSEMGLPGIRTWKELHGEPCIEFEDTAQARKQIMISRTFAKEISDPEELSAQVSMFCSMAVEKLRKQGSCCGSATTFIMTNRFHEGAETQYGSRLAQFTTATDSTFEINSAVLKSLKELFRNGYRYKRAGVILGDIIPADKVQMEFFDTVDRERHSRLMSVMDSINRRNGRNTIGVASQSLDGIKMNREHLSPCYTTDWNDILTVKC